MAIEKEAIIEKNLIEKLCSGVSQWTYRPDLKNEDELWANVKYILEQNNKKFLCDSKLSEAEFSQVKNQLSHQSFYDAGKFIKGENGKVQVHITRGNEKLHLTVINNEQIAGGTSVYEVINQFTSFKDDTKEGSRNRRFDVSLLINGLPVIHIELKSKNESCGKAFNQIKKYVKEGKFTGIFSNVQMFVVSNVKDTKYFAPARDYELNPVFMSSWTDINNEPIKDYIQFADDVLKIPNAHELIAKYTVLDNSANRLIIMRPYQVHAIEAMREASKKGLSGFIWHTTGSGKTLTSYKATRNLLMDIPSIDKTIFLIDRKDLDNQTTTAFQSYAETDSVDVDDTANVGELLQKLSNDDRQMIVTTIQKLHIVIKNKDDVNLQKYYKKIDAKRIAFVVDECHRAVTPSTKRLLQSYFNNSLWYGFTGTPRFTENSYEEMGDLPRTTEQLYGKCLHKYTIKEAIRDGAVLGFMVDRLGPKEEITDPDYYEKEPHQRAVLNTIFNKSQDLFGIGKKALGHHYEAILTVKSIKIAQEYYSLIKKIKAGEDKLKIDENIKKVLPDFPKVAITYSVTENEDGSTVNQDKMLESLKDYNTMFGTSFNSLDKIGAYNNNLNDRLSRKKSMYKAREEQLDLVIVVDRLLTGFDAPSVNILFIDRPPMEYHALIQAFSRTNRIFDKDKDYGHIVTFQEPKTFKENIDNALTLFSAGGLGNGAFEDFDSVKESFETSIKALHALVPTADDVKTLSKDKKRVFLTLFRAVDKDFSHFKSFSSYEESMLSDLNFSIAEYEDYKAMYLNVVEELKDEKPIEPSVPNPDDDTIDDDDYELKSFGKITINFEYIVELIQSLPEIEKEEDFKRHIESYRNYAKEYESQSKVLSKMLLNLLDEIEKDRAKFKGVNISEYIYNKVDEAVKKIIKEYSQKWYVPFEMILSEVHTYKNDVLTNETAFKDSADYSKYAENTENPIAKFKFRTELIKDFKEVLIPTVSPYFEVWM